MTFTGKILNSDATLNAFREIGSVDFMPGSVLRLAIMLFNPQAELRFVPGPNAEITLFFPLISGESLEKVATLNPDDRSLMIVTLSASETGDLTGGNITFTVDEEGDASVISKGYISGAMRRVTVGESDC